MVKKQRLTFIFNETTLEIDSTFWSPQSAFSFSLSAIERQGEHNELRNSTSHNGSCSVNDLRAQPTSCTTLAGYDTVSGFGVKKVERLMNVEEVTMVFNQHSWNDSSIPNSWLGPALAQYNRTYGHIILYEIKMKIYSHNSHSVWTFSPCYSCC